MSESAIRAENLGKRYLLGKRQSNARLSEHISDWMKNPLRKLWQSKVSQDSFWALRNVSFEIGRGEVVGLIGPNGSGKSTLLKILSRITYPTEGFAEINGRVGSLLEVGVGFHPELSGRENVFLSGTILGMKHKDVQRKFDEIVAFAEIEQFIDTPVKRYSSGMYVRLAFAVAAHLQQDILLIDEVLAVGDAAFQKKCLSTMQGVSQTGRTVLFVSHNMGAVAQLCSRAILLNAGQVKCVGPAKQVVEGYFGDLTKTGEVTFDPSSKPACDMPFTRCWIARKDGSIATELSVTEPFSIGIEFLVRRTVQSSEAGISVCNSYGQRIFSTNVSDAGHDCGSLEPGRHIFLLDVPGQFLAPGSYSLIIATHRPNIEYMDCYEHVLNFSIIESGSKLWKYSGSKYGDVLVHFPWQKQDVGE